jgi:hypothetical protein
VYEDPDHRDTHDYPDRGEGQGCPDHRLDHRPTGGESALGDDHHEGAETQNPGKVDVLELDA